ncbi:Kinase, NEK [Giardia lamblia P15]|uniref:Kinase, NEK n=1 Tax=Giardia intestinalis (strain P15) TaxID=658858 RepID=E1F3U8_GIAIA|nr:Kinase, NEK [Giardia lamblia P15]
MSSSSSNTALDTNFLNRFGYCIGQGAYGTVYSLSDDPDEAVKEMRIDGMPEDALEAFETEIRIMPQLSHPNILRYKAVHEEGDFVYIRMQRYAKSLEDMIKMYKRKRKEFPRDKIIEVLLQVTTGLAYLHSPNKHDTTESLLSAVIIHRDLKPANILTNDDETQFVIADFGFCREALKDGSTTVGSPMYFAPEVLLKKKYSPASDMWSLGVIIYELVSGVRPSFLSNIKSESDLSEAWRPDLEAINDGFIRSVLETLLILNPSDRSSAEQLLKDLTEYLTSRESKGTLRFKELEAKHNALQKTHKQCTIEIGMLKEMCDAKEVELTGCKKHSTKLEAEVTTLRQQLSSLKTTVSTLERTLKDEQLLKKSLTYENDELKKKLGCMESLQRFSMLTRLMRTVISNNIKLAHAFIDEDIQKRDDRSFTALMHAAQRGHTAFIPLLVDKEKGIQDKYGYTALMHAAYSGHTDVVEELAKYEREIKNNQTLTALMVAAGRNHVDSVKILVDHENNLTNGKGETSLMIAAEHGHVETVKVLMDYELKTQCKLGYTALMIAARKGHTEVINLLVDAEKNLQANDGRTALMIAAESSNKTAAEVLMAHEKDASKWTTLMRAAALGDVQLIDCSINERGRIDSLGRTSLIIAAQNNRTEAVKRLAKHESGVSGWTILMYASCIGDVELAAHNLHEVKRKDDTGMTALMWAAMHGHHELVELLVEHEHGILDKDGNTAMMWASQNGHSKSVSLLLDYEKGMKNSKGMTSLMLGAAAGHLAVAQILLDAECNLQDSNLKTALMHAAMNGHVRVVKALAESERDIVDADRCTVLQLAKQYGQQDVVEFLDGASFT